MRTSDRVVWVIGRGVGRVLPAVSHREGGPLHHEVGPLNGVVASWLFFSFVLAPRRDGALHRDSHAPHSIPVAIENGMVLTSVTYKGASLAACGGRPMYAGLGLLSKWSRSPPSLNCAKPPQNKPSSNCGDRL